MSFKYFRLLVMAQLLPQCWNIQYHSLKDELDKKYSALQSLLPKDTPQTALNILKDINIQTNTLLEIARDRDNLMVENMRLDDKFGQICRSLKMRDWIVELEADKFPRWLKYAPVNRYFKWLSALLYVESDYFNNLRADLKKNCIAYEDFAAEMHNAYEKAPMYARDIPSISKPKEDQVDYFCKFMNMADTLKAYLACKVVVGAVPEKMGTAGELISGASKPVNSTVKSKNTLKFYIYITGVSSTVFNLDEQHMDAIDAIETSPEFEQQSCAIVFNASMAGYPLQTSEHGKRSKQDLPGFFFIVESESNPMDVPDNERREKWTSYEKLKDEMRNYILSKKSLENVNVGIADDYSYLTNRDHSVDAVHLDDDSDGK